MENMCNASENQTCQYYYPRSKAIADHGLPDDDLLSGGQIGQTRYEEGEEGDAEGVMEEGEEEEKEEDDEEEEDAEGEEKGEMEEQEERAQNLEEACCRNE